MDGGAWWAADHGVAKSWTWLSTRTHTHTDTHTGLKYSSRYLTQQKDLQFESQGVSQELMEGKI